MLLIKYLYSNIFQIKPKRRSYIPLFSPLLLKEIPLINEILKLEKQAQELEPTEGRRDEFLQAARDYANTFLNSLDEKKVYNVDFEDVKLLDEAGISEEPADLSEIIHLLDRAVDSPGLDPASPGHLGYIPGGGVYTSSIGDYLAAVFNKFAGLYFSSPGAVKLENQLIRWTAELIGYPEEALGNVTSGGSIANLTALATARDAKKITPERISKSVIYITEQTHHCVHKAVRIAGLSHCIQRIVSMDDHFRMDSAELEKCVVQDVADGLIPFYVAASCGSTDTGSVDSFEDIADICETHDIWFHIDAAYGGYFVLVDELKPLFKGMERSDSVVVDPHKSLFLPYGIGIALIKDGKALFDTFHYMANYLQDIFQSEEEVSPADLSPELTKHFRGLRMWLPLQLHGVAPFRACLKEKYLLTLYFYEEVQKLGFEIGPKPQLSVAIYRYVPQQGDANVYNEKLVKSIKTDGRMLVSSTTIDWIFWIRIAIVSFRTHKRHIDLYLSILKEFVSAQGN